MTLAGQRGDIDCGGLRYLIVAYGNFWQLVLPTGPRSHLSVGVERDADPVAVAGRVLAIIGAQPGQSTGAANGLS